MIDNILELAMKNENIVSLWLYGSRAKGNAKPDSDYDIAVIFSEYEQNPLRRRTRPEILAIDWVQLLGLDEGSISVLDLELAPIPLGMAVLTTGKMLLNKNPSRELFVSKKIMSKWEIDYQYHYKHYG